MYTGVYIDWKKEKRSDEIKEAFKVEEDKKKFAVNFPTSSFHFFHGDWQFSTTESFQAWIGSPGNPDSIKFNARSPSNFISCQLTLYAGLFTTKLNENATFQIKSFGNGFFYWFVIDFIFWNNYLVNGKIVKKKCGVSQQYRGCAMVEKN